MIKTNNKVKNKGITLIALIITIIILLILAGVAITTLTGDDGLFRRAKDASEVSKEAEEKEQIGLAYNAAIIESKGEKVTEIQLETELKKYGSGITVKIDGTNFKVTYPNGHEYTVESNGSIIGLKTGEKPGKPDGNGIFTESSTIDGQKTSSKENPIIPQGFKPIDEGEAVWGNGEKAPEKNSVDNGLVIEDIEHNQFVWVPVDSSKFQIAEGYYDGKKDSMILELKCAEPYENGYATEKDEYNKMKLSVTTNGGFYIGRYESGIEGGVLKQDTVDPNKYYWEGGNVVVKKDVTVYNWIGWNASESKAMNDETGGAVQKSKEFKKRKGI